MADINENADLTLQFFCKSLAKEFYSNYGIIAWYSGIDNKSLNSVYVLYTKGEPVTAASVSYSQYGARIDNVATKNNYLRQGYAYKIILYILKQAKKLGFRYCYLDASDLGLQLYKKLGFTICYSNKIYSLN